jgi:hypothetical protein
MATLKASLKDNCQRSKGLKKGLQARHAYSITKVVKIKTRKLGTVIPLVRLRYSHDNSEEWKGEWSDR